MTPTRVNSPIPARAGIGLRLPHQPLVLAQRPETPWFEVHPENYMADAAALAELELVRRDYPLSLHAVGLSLGSAAGVDPAHIARLHRLERQLEPALVSDHLSWSVSDGRYLPDLLPLPYTDEALRIVSRNVTQVQDALGRQLLVENPSTYLQYAASAMPEADFLAELARRSGCGVLLDVNNIHVSACNQQADPRAVLADFARALPAASVREMHLAGHARVAAVLIDDHGDRVCAAVWQLYEQALAAFGPVPTLIEWDTRLPDFAVLQDEAALAQARIDAESARRAPVAARAPRAATAQSQAHHG